MEDEQQKLTYQKVISEWTQKVEDKVPKAMEGLSDAQKEQLVALIIDSLESFDTYLMSKSIKNYIRDYLKREKAWNHKLDNKAASTRKAIEKWREEIFIKSPFPLTNIALNENVIGVNARTRLFCENHDDVEVVDKMISALKNRRTSSLSPDLKALFAKLIGSCAVKNLASDYMVFIYWFFRHGCNCRMGDAEERVALIRNYFWKGLAKSVKPNSEYYYENTHGCNAVRLAVNRYRMPQ